MEPKNPNRPETVDPNRTRPKLPVLDQTRSSEYEMLLIGKTYVVFG